MSKHYAQLFTSVSLLLIGSSVNAFTLQNPQARLADPSPLLAEAGKAPLAETLDENERLLAQLKRYLSNADYQSLIDRVEALDLEQLKPEHHQMRVRAYLNLDLDDAEDASEQALEQYPDEADLYLMHANVMGAQASDSIFSALGYAKKAKKSLEKAVSLAPQKTKYHWALMGFYLNVPSIAGGDTELALTQVEQIESLDVLEGKLARANYLKGTEQQAQALTLLSQAKEDFPNNIRVLNELASYFIREEAYALAIENYKALVDVQLQAPIGDEQSVIDDYYESRYTKLNAHYQIGRAALKHSESFQKADDDTSTEHDKKLRAIGIANLREYIRQSQSLANQNTKDFLYIDTSSLPSIDWANLRLSSLLLEDGQQDKASALFKTVLLDKRSDQMKEVYQELKQAL